MNTFTVKNRELSSSSSIPSLSPEQLARFAIEGYKAGLRACGSFALSEGENLRIVLMLADDKLGNVQVASTSVPRGTPFPSMTPEAPQWHLFERELWEDHGVEITGHPWLKPVRFPHDAAQKRGLGDYSFFSMTGEEVHEVAVGPVHAGVIEPGHFRFMCDGERVNHLEIQLGYQHRGVRSLMERGDLRSKSVLAESISGDAAIAHAIAHAGLVEALCGVVVPPRAALIRSLALELERVGIHLGDLSALCNDIGYLPGTQMLGAMRTVVINTTQSLCGNRFGRGLIRPGGVLFDIDEPLADKMRGGLSRIQKSEDILVQSIFDNQAILARFEKTGLVDTETARAIGLVGPAGRSSGLSCDVRLSHPTDAMEKHPFIKVDLADGFASASRSGDVFARAYIRHREIQDSLTYARKMIDELPKSASDLRATVPAPARDSFAVSLVEGWRGEVMHTAMTGADGSTLRYAIKDPSFHNWFGLGLAVRDNGVSDFPLCNKSFNLSYCGFDL